MFRIRKIFDDVQSANRAALKEVAAILRSQFRALSQANADRIPDLLRNPLR